MVERPHTMLTTGKIPAPWHREGKIWLDMVPGAEVELPGIAFACRMDRRDNAFHLALKYQLEGAAQEFSAELGASLNLTPIAGFHCIVIPRAIRPCDEKRPAAVQLEIATIRQEKKQCA